MRKNFLLIAPCVVGCVTHNRDVPLRLIGEEYCLHIDSADLPRSTWFDFPIEEERRYYNDAALCRCDFHDADVLKKDMALKGDTDAQISLCLGYVNECHSDSLAEPFCAWYRNSPRARKDIDSAMSFCKVDSGVK